MKLLAMDEVKLAFDEDALRAIAHKAKEKKVGAACAPRGDRGIHAGYHV